MKSITNSMFAFMVKTSWRYAGADRPRMLLFYAMFLVANIVIAFQPIILENIIDTVQGGGDKAIWHVLTLAALYGSLTIVFWMLHGPARVMERRIGFNIFDDYVAMLYRKIADMPLRWHQDHHSGDTINRVNKAGRALFNFAQEQFIIIQMVVRFVMSLVLLGFYSVWVLVASLTASIIITVILRRFDVRLVPLMNTTNEREHHLNAGLFDYISNIITVITLRLQGNTREEIQHRLDTMRPSFWSEAAVNEWKWGVINILLVITQAGIIGAYIAIHMWRQQHLDVGSIVAIFQYLLMISSVFYSGAEVYNRLMQRRTDIHGVDELLESHARLKPLATEDFAKMWKHISIRDLQFTHHEGEEVLHHLRDVNLEIKAGQKIAFIGSSGSGKTTLLTLLRGLYEARQVKLSIDGEVFTSLAPLSGFTTLVPQDSEIFENTVLYNLTLGIDIPDVVVQQALSVTTFDDVAPKLPDGLATDIRERGVNLSGGQKQRLALARGFIAARDSSLMLLDEPTSSVDLATESVIFDRLFQAFKDKAIVASIHRLHLVPRFDWICLMRDGEIIEQGPFMELLADCGAFHDIWEYHLTQSGTGDGKSEKI